jgi:hypothetical protein
MTVVHFGKVSVLYPRVVISSLANRLEKTPFCHSYTSFFAWPRYHYMSLQRFTVGRMPGLAKVYIFYSCFVLSFDACIVTITWSHLFVVLAL